MSPLASRGRRQPHRVPAYQGVDPAELPSESEGAEGTPWRADDAASELAERTEPQRKNPQ